MTRLAIVGCGKMGQAIVKGLAHQQTVEVTGVSTRRQANVDRLARELGVFASTDNLEAARRADVVLLATKPQKAHQAVESIASTMQGKTLISLCAGVTNDKLASWLPETAIIRAMPNTPALIGEGMTVISPGPRAEASNMAVAEEIFSAVGRVRELDEVHLDVVTGLSGSGPAFACVILEALADGGVRMGLPRDVAIELAAQTFQGAARLVLETGMHPAALKDEVTTPAGCTIAGLLIMEDGRIRSTLARTIEEAARVASGLGE